MYYYSTVNGIIMTHSALLEKDGFDIVKVHFERPNEDGFDFLDMTLPGEIVYKSFGFSEDEILKLKRYAKNNSSLISITITEGRNRQVRKMCEAVGFEVKKLKRVAFGGITLEGLGVGEYRALKPHEIKKLYSL